MNFKHYLFVLIVFTLFSCKQEKAHLTKIQGVQINISDSLELNEEIDAIIKPFRDHLNKDLDSVISYAVDTYSKMDGELNTAIGNFMADVVYEQANPVFKSQTGHDIDMVLINHGGIRSIISKGNITTRTAFEVMPFENSIVVVKLKGTNIIQLIEYLRSAKRAHPISQLKLTLDSDYNVSEALIKGQVIDTLKTYYVATNDYLYNGGDRMDFFHPNDSLFVLDYKIRNAILDKFKKEDTINPVIDDRFQIKVN